MEAFILDLSATLDVRILSRMAPDPIKIRLGVSSIMLAIGIRFFNAKNEKKTRPYTRQHQSRTLGRGVDGS